MSILNDRKARARECLDMVEELRNLADAESRDMTPEEATKHDGLMDEHEQLLVDIARRERLEAAKTASTETTRTSEPMVPDNASRAMQSISFPKTRIKELRAFKGVDAEEKAYRAGLWLAATIYGSQEARLKCADIGISTRTMVEGDNTKGGVLVVNEFDRAIIDLREQYGVFRREARVVPMASDTKDVPRRVSGVTAYAVGEGTEITASDKGWDMVTLSAKMWGCLTKMSKELSADAVINVADDLAAEMGYAFALKEDQAGINGDGTSTYHGISGIRAKMIDGNHAGSYFTAPGAANSCDIWSEVGLDDLDGTMGILPAYALMRSPKWYCPVGAVHSIFGRLARAQGGSTGKELADGVPQTYAGYPIVPVPAWADTASTDYSAKIMLLFGDLALAAMVGDRQGTSVQVLQERYAELGVLGVIGNIRFDVNIHDIGSSTAAGPVVGLLGN